MKVEKFLSATLSTNKIRIFKNGELLIEGNSSSIYNQEIFNSEIKNISAEGVKLMIINIK